MPDNRLSFSFRTIGALLMVLTLSAPRVALTQSAGDYVIGAQDVLSIAVFDQTDLGGKYAVELDGSFTFPLVGRVQAGGLTIRNFEGELKKRLADGFFKNPQVTVAIEQYRSQRVFVTGEVRSPGAYALTGDMTLIEALAKAGSTTPNASEEAVVVRGTKGVDGPITLDAAGDKEILRFNLKDLQSGAASVRNIDLRDGDTIYIARAELVYIFGEVKNPAAYPIKTDTTVLQALSLAGGVTPNGAINRTKIIRIVEGDKKEISVKLTAIVQPGDTIMVPERYF
jgi:polysaccharide export outer membrane protein